MSTKGRMLERLHVILGGRAAEEVPIFSSHGISMNIHRADQLSSPSSLCSGRLEGARVIWHLRKLGASCDVLHWRR